jgi:hypothetical protein
VPTTRQCSGSKTAIFATEKILHTLPRWWPCARGTTIRVIATTVPSLRGLSSAGRLARGLRLCDPDALWRGRCRVLGLHCRWPFSFLLSLNCLSHVNILGGEWTKGKGRTRRRGEERRGEAWEMLNSRRSRFGNDAPWLDYVMRSKM